jgi:hypothetical protein
MSFVVLVAAFDVIDKLLFKLQRDTGTNKAFIKYTTTLDKLTN